MSTGIKNGKHCTNNIYMIKLIFPVCYSYYSISFSISCQEMIKNWVIVIDAGHGGKDPGALGSFSS